MKMTRHMWMAIAIAPLLGIGSYFLAGVMMDRPQVPEKGEQKPMIPIVLENCQLSTNSCEGYSKDDRLKAKFTLEEENDDLTFYFSGNRPLENTMLQLNKNIEPYLLDNRGAGQWQIKLDIAYKSKLNTLYFVAQHEKALYYAELPY